jgi:hypothetical protein
MVMNMIMSMFMTMGRPRFVTVACSGLFRRPLGSNFVRQENLFRKNQLNETLGFSYREELGKCRLTWSTWAFSSHLL